MNFFRKLFHRCKHDYHKIDIDIRVYPNYDTMRYESTEYLILYCPKCDKEKRVNVEEYERELAKDRIRKQYT